MMSWQSDLHYLSSHRPRTAEFVAKRHSQSKATMQASLLAASGIAILTGLAHSVIGEWLIFRHVRKNALVPTLPAPPLQSRHIRILWATWHALTVFGWAFAALLFHIALTPASPSTSFVLGVIVVANMAGSLLVLVGTRGRHPGWVALALIAGFTWLAMGAG